MAPGGAWGLVGCLLGDDDQIICGKYNVVLENDQIICGKYNVVLENDKIICGKYNVVLENVRYCQEQIQSLGTGGSNHLWPIISL